MNQSGDSNDLRFFWVVVCGVVIVTALPYVIGLALTPAGFQFQGNTFLAPGDPNVYYSYIEQARQEAWLMRDVFTSEPHAATLWQPVWLVLGWLANLLHVSTPTIYALGRVISMAVLALTLWWAIRWFWDDRITRRTALLLALGGAGLGGIVATVFRLDLSNVLVLPPDLWVSEMVPILSSWTTPHFLLVTSGWLYVAVSIERSWVTKSWSSFWLIGVVALLTFSVHPFHLLTLGAMWITLTAWRWWRAKKFPWAYLARWGAVVIMSLPAMVYYLVGLLADPIVQGRAAQNINATPSIFFVAIGLGALPLLAGLGVWLNRRTTTKHGWLIAWAGAQALIVFLPLASQRRLMQAMVVPLALLAAPVVASAWRRWGWSGLRRMAFVLVGVTAFGGSTIVAGNHIIADYVAERQGRNYWEYYLTPEYQSLFAYLKSSTSVHQPVLASLWNSNLIAGFSARTVVAGHPVETLQHDQKIEAVKNFFTATSEQQAAILNKYGVCYVLQGPREAAYGEAFQPGDWPNLAVAWSGTTMTLYRVTDCSAAK